MKIADSCKPSFNVIQENLIALDSMSDPIYCKFWVEAMVNLF